MGLLRGKRVLLFSPHRAAAHSTQNTQDWPPKSRPTHLATVGQTTKIYSYSALVPKFVLFFNYLFAFYSPAANLEIIFCCNSQFWFDQHEKRAYFANLICYRIPYLLIYNFHLCSRARLCECVCVYFLLALLGFSVVVFAKPLLFFRHTIHGAYAHKRPITEYCARLLLHLVGCMFSPANPFFQQLINYLFTRTQRC